MDITVEILKQVIYPKKGNAEILEELAPALSSILPDYEINNYLRVCHFLGQAAHEADGFNTLQEYASGKAYEGRRDLGNTQTGDGRRFKGRGIFQLTGRANYTTMSKKLGVDLVGNPELAASAELSVHIACLYWNSRKLSVYADADDLRTITKKINGGFNGLDDRIQCTDNARIALAPLFPDEVEIIQ